MHLRFDGVEIGCTRDDPLCIADYEPPTTELDGERTARLGVDGVLAGRTHLRDALWGFSLSVRDVGTNGVLARAGALERAWKDPTARAGAPAPLEYSADHGSTWHRVYGVPGRYTGPKADYLAARGYGDITIQFEQTDPLHYASTQRAASIVVSPEASGGITAPLTAPLVPSRTGGVVQRLVTNHGDKPTPVRFSFHGPIQRPGLSVAGRWSWSLAGDLAWDEWLEVDALARTVRRGWSTSSQVVSAFEQVAPGAAGFSRMRLPAGESSVSLTGVDVTGRARVDVFWRDAFTSMQYGGND